MIKKFLTRVRKFFKKKRIGLSKFMTLDKKFLFATVVITLIPLMLVEVYSYKTIIKKELSQYKDTIIQEKISNFEIKLNGIEAVVKNITNLDDIKKILLTENNETDIYTKLKTQADIGCILSNYLDLQDTLSIDIFSINGNHYHVGENLEKESVNSKTIKLLHDKASEMDGNTYYSGVIHNFFVSSKTEYIVSACSLITTIDPQTLESKELGFLIMTYDANNVAMFDPNYEDGPTMMLIVDQNKKIVYSDKEELIGSLVNISDKSLESMIYKEYGIKKNNYVIESSNLSSLGWSLIVVIPKSAYLKHISSLSNNLLLAFIVSFFALYIFFLHFSKKFINPIRKLTEHFKEYNDGGDLRPMKRSVRTYDEIGDLITWFNQYIKDLEDKKDTEVKLEDSISQQYHVVNGISEAILQLSLDGKIAFLNPAWRNISGYRVDESIGIEFVSYVTDDDKKRFQNTFNDLIIGKYKNYTENIRLVKKDEIFVWVEIRFSAMRSNKDVFIVGVLSDVSESVEINNMKDEFVNTVSHELRTPLTAIKESLNLVMSPETGSLCEMHESLLEITTRNIDRLNGVVNNVLQYQKYQAETLKMPMHLENINRIIEEALCLIIPMANKKGLKLEAEMEHALPNVMCNRDSISQLLFNLINNSLKFTQKGSIKIKSAVKETFILVTVTDTGIGIKKEDQKKLFSTFSQVKNRSNANPGSSGLGLAICRKIITRHNGIIWVESDYGKGSVFCFTLPITEFNLKLFNRENQHI